MRYFLHKIDADGLFLEDVFFETEDATPEDMISAPVPGGFHHPRWNGTAWEEGGTPSLSVYACSPWQIRKMLNLLGLRDGVEAAVAASDDQAMKDGWEFASEFRSDDPFVLTMGAMLGKTEAELADLIKQASYL